LVAQADSASAAISRAEGNASLLVLDILFSRNTVVRYGKGNPPIVIRAMQTSGVTFMLQCRPNQRTGSPLS
jgi:hypothetical protein